MRNGELIDKFMNGLEGGYASNLYIQDNELVNCGTVIAFRIAGQPIVLNGDHYSQTTSVHQNRIRRSGKEYIEVTEKVINRVIDSMNYEELGDYHIRCNEQNVG